MITRELAQERLRGIASMVAAVCVFSMMDALLKRLSNHYGPMQIACLRCLSSLGFVAFPILWKRSWASLRPNMPALHLLRVLIGTGMLASFVFAVHRLSLAETYSLFLCAPLLMTALSIPLQGERVPAKRWFAIALGLGGVLVILQPWGKGFTSMAAAAAAALSTICYALSALTVRSLGRGNSNLSMVFWFLLGVGLTSGLLAISDWQPIAANDWIWLVGVGFSGFIAQYWITDAFSRAPASVVGPFEYTSILWAFLIDWFFWSATPTVNLMIGAAIVVISGVFIVVDEHRMAQLALTPASPPP